MVGGGRPLVPHLWLTPEGEAWCDTGGVSGPALSILSHVRPVCRDLSEQWAVNQISQPVWTVLTIIKHGVGDTRDRGTPGTGGQAPTVNELRDGGDQSPRCPWPRLNPDRVDPEPDTDYTEIQRYRARGIQSRGLHSFRILITIHGVCSGYLHFSIYYLSDCSQEIVSK